MTPTEAEYRESAWCNPFSSGLLFCVAMEAWREATVGEHTDAQQFDSNITAAIHAGEWLDRVFADHKR